MNPTTPQPNSQLSHADTRANLGFITEMHKQLVQYKYPGKQSPQASQEPQNAPGQESEPKEENSQLNDLESKMEAKMEILRTEMKDTMKTEIGSIKEMIQKALSEDEQEKTN